MSCLKKKIKCLLSRLFNSGLEVIKLEFIFKLKIRAMIGCWRTRVREQPIIAIYFESENELKFYNLEAKSDCICTCFPVECENPTAPAHGHVATPHGIDFESLAVYSCEDGYDLSYPAYRTCLKSGKWSGHEPHCDPKRKLMHSLRLNASRVKVQNSCTVGWSFPPTSNTRIFTN